MDSSFNLAVHALVCLSHSGRSLSSEALAENICTNPTRVRRVLAGLKKVSHRKMPTPTRKTTTTMGMTRFRLRSWASS